MTPRDEAAARDLTLLERVRAGDAVALDALLQFYGAPMLRLAQHVVHTATQAEDVVQDVFLELWRERSQLAITRDVAAYLFWRTRNRAIDVMRTEQAALARDGAWVTATRTETTVNAGEHLLDEADMRARIWRALADVPPRARDVFMLVWDEQLPYAEVARILGVSVPAVRNYMSRAVRHLSETLSARR